MNPFRAVRLPLLVLAAASVVAAGCQGRGRDREIVGKWYWSGQEPSSDETIAFKEDGTWESRRVDGGRGGWGDGSWSLSGDALSLTVTMVDPPDPAPLVFGLSKDGGRLTAEKAEIGTMAKGDRPPAPPRG